MALTTVLTTQCVADLTTARDLVTTTSPLNYRNRFTLTNGTGAGAADLIFSDTRTVNASSNDDLDLAGSLTDANGATLTFARIKALIVKASASNSNNVLVGGDATNTFLTYVVTEGDAIVLRPGAELALFAGSADATGYAVTAGTGDLLRISNSGAGTSVTYDIVIVGASA